MKPLHRAFVSRARRCPLRLAWADARVPRLCFGAALAKTVFLARRLRSHWAGQEMVGILLPPSVAAALANFAAMLMGKIPVNLNYTLSEELLAACARRCRLETVLTSRVFLDRIKVKIPTRALLVEEMAARPRLGETLLAMALAWLAPAGRLERAVGRLQPASLDDLATVIFSSGSTGDPKGVMLTHSNLVSNAEQLDQTYHFGPQDRFLGVLPFFHSFGFTATLITPALFGVGVAYHPNPLDAKPIGSLARRYRATYLMATPTFLQLYLRGCEPADFASLRLVMVGAEKLPERLATAFEQKFGIRPVEGYGCTECSPVIAANTRQALQGSVGRPLPGMSVRIVHPETGAPVPPGEPGLLMVQGPNVMRGYLGQPEKTAEALRNGWYVTGDIASLDADGFLHITDRLSRFSKIGGEMVPHVQIEEKLHEAAGATEIAFVVCGVPDPKKGERLLVFHTLPEDRIAEVVQRLPLMGLPNLWIPRRNQFVRLETFPRLASGKTDWRTLREMALGLAAPKADEAPDEA
ncbi:MAG TPA: AMP-binding protein [Candidatus Paceibacterota bacterium]|nr:AMP-binding protein [Verrucomicrobiota bacterium]HRZ44495.1 AMP-binding protein [Candidatus Paceibacterota bacterium]